MAAERRCLARRRVDGPRGPSQPGRGPGLRGNDGSGPGRQPLLPEAARPRHGRVARAPRRGLPPERDGPPRRLGGRRGRRRQGRSLRRATRGVARPPLPQPRRRHLRGRDGGRGPARPRQHVAVALRRRGQRRRPGPPARDPHRPRPLRERREGTFHPGGRRLSLLAAAPGLAHLRQHGGLRPRRLPRPLPLHLLLLHRAERGQGGDAHSLPRRGERAARRALPQRRPGALPGRDRGDRSRREQRPLRLRRRLGRLRRRRLARPARGQRLRPQEPLPQPGTRRTARSASGTWRRRRESRTTARG